MIAAFVHQKTVTLLREYPKITYPEQEVAE